MQRVHIADHIAADDEPHRIDPDRWQPLIMRFPRFHGPADTELVGSTPATVPELYRSPDVDRAAEERPTARRSQGCP